MKTDLFEAQAQKIHSYCGVGDMFQRAQVIKWLYILKEIGKSDRIHKDIFHLSKMCYVKTSLGWRGWQYTSW